jgi:hypothetical protein
MLTANELVSLRATQAATLTAGAVVQRLTLASDSMGGFSESAATAVTTTCRVAPARAGDAQLVAGRLRERTPVRITVPAATDVRPVDRLVAGGVTYEVLAVLAPGTYETARVCLAVEA